MKTKKHVSRGLLQSYKRDDQAYIRALLYPFTTAPSRGPSSFYLPTSLLDYKFVADLNFGTSNTGVAVLYPWFMLG